MKKITKKDIARVEESLREARREGNDKRITFLEATLSRYKKLTAQSKKKSSNEKVKELMAELEEARREGNDKRVTFLEATLGRIEKGDL